MANELILKRRIKTAQNVSKTTRAMQMIAASKLKNAQDHVMASRPYVKRIAHVTKDALAQEEQDVFHPYMKETSAKSSLYILFAPDKGLCGGLVTNVLREYVKVAKDEHALFITVGKKIENFVATTAGKQLIASFPFHTSVPSFLQVLPLIKIIRELYEIEKVARVLVLTSHFHSVFSQAPVVTQLLPLHLDEVTVDSPNILFEPNAHDVIPDLLDRYIEAVLYQQFLESYASEQAARMIAMQNATDNARDIVSELKLVYNKARQERITNEILDITGAAVSLAMNN